jgi:hypothetical protein
MAVLGDYGTPMVALGTPMARPPCLPPVHLRLGLLDSTPAPRALLPSHGPSCTALHCTVPDMVIRRPPDYNTTCRGRRKELSSGTIYFSTRRYVARRQTFGAKDWRRCRDMLSLVGLSNLRANTFLPISLGVD